MSEPSKTGNVSIDVHADDSTKRLELDENLLAFIDEIGHQSLYELCETCDKLDLEYKTTKDVNTANRVCRRINAANENLKERIRRNMEQMAEYAKDFGAMAKPHTVVSEMTYFNTWFSMRGGWH